MTTIAFFNSSRGSGTTTLVYHLAWMFADLGREVIAADLDPHASLTSRFLDEASCAQLWLDERPFPTRSLFAAPHIETIDDRISLLPGDPALATLEEQFADAWLHLRTRGRTPFETVTAFQVAILKAAEAKGADFVLLDLGPNLAAINHAALIASDLVIIPVAPDLHSLAGLRILGPQLREWREGWRNFLRNNSGPAIRLAGYAVAEYAARPERPRNSYRRWMEATPDEYHQWVVGEPPGHTLTLGSDPHRLGTLRNYRSLMQMAVDARKPMFHLKPADGALGAHTHAVRDCYNDFHSLASRLAEVAVA